MLQQKFTILGYTLTLFDFIESIIIPCCIIILVAIIVYGISKIILRAIYNVNKKKNKSTATEVIHVYKKYLRRIRRVLFVVILFSFMIVIMRFLSNMGRIPNVTTIFTKPLYSSGKTQISILSLIFILFLGYISYWISGITRRVTKLLISNFSKEVGRKYAPLIHIGGYGTLTITFIIGLSIIGIDLTSFFVLFGILGVGIGFGLQDIIANFFSGLIIGFSRIITEGDRVLIQGVEGDVQQINLINTVIRSITDEELIVPNKFILNESIQNFSHSDTYALISAEVQVSYQADMHKVEDIIVQAAQQLPWNVQGNDALCFFRFQSFDSSGITVSVFTRIRNIKDRYEAKSNLNMLIWEHFKAADIDIPFPQLDIHMKKTDMKKMIIENQNIDENIVKGT